MRAEGERAARILAQLPASGAAAGNGIGGNGGNNVITVTGGADSVSGGEGVDRLVVDYEGTPGAVTGTSTSNFADASGLGTVTITGGFEHITILTGGGADTITTGAGDDIIRTGEGASTVVAGDGANQVYGGSGVDKVTTGSGDDRIEAGDGANTLTSGEGADIIITGTGKDTIVADAGNDVITVRGGADTLDSGAGQDRLIVDYSLTGTAVTGGVTGGDLTGYTGEIADLALNKVGFVATEHFSIITESGHAGPRADARLGDRWTALAPHLHLSPRLRIVAMARDLCRDQGVTARV